MSVFTDPHPKTMFISNTDLSAVQAAAASKKVTIGTTVIVTDADLMFIVRPNMAGPGFILKPI